MSHEGCVWHPIPEDVRRSSIQSRRASLAAGRRKSMMSNEPDWEVEAPPTPPPADQYSPRQPAPAPAAAAAPAAPAAPAAKELEAPANETEAHTKQQEANAAEQPVSNEAQPTYPTEGENHVAKPESVAQQPAAAAAAQEPEAAAPAQQAEPTAAAKEPEAVAGAAGKTAPAAHKQVKVLHTVCFRGAEWGDVVSKKADEIKKNFVMDIEESTGLEESQVENVEARMEKVLIVTFYVRVTEDERTGKEAVHSKLKGFAFPHVCSLYPVE